MCILEFSQVEQLKKWREETSGHVSAVSSSCRFCFPSLTCSQTCPQVGSKCVSLVLKTDWPKTTSWLRRGHLWCFLSSLFSQKQPKKVKLKNGQMCPFQYYLQPDHFQYTFFGQPPLYVDVKNSTNNFRLRTARNNIPTEIYDTADLKSFGRIHVH